MPSSSPRMPLWTLPAGILALAGIAFVAAPWQRSAPSAHKAPADTRTKTSARSTKAPPTAEEALDLRRELLAEVEANGLSALSRIDESWPDSLRRSLRQAMLEHHGIQHPLESLEWLAKHPRIEGSGPLGVELSYSLHARAGNEAGKSEPWQTAFERLDKIASHGTSREHLAYLQSVLVAMRSAALLPFTAREIRSMRLSPQTKAVALAGLGDLRAGLDFLQAGGTDYPVAHLATQQWLTLGRMPASFTETANRLLALAPPGEQGAAEVARSLRHPHLDRNIALWLRDQPAGPARDEVLSEIAADISLSDPSFAKAVLQKPSVP